MASQFSSRRSRRLWQLTAPVTTSAVIAAALSATVAGVADAEPRPDSGEGGVTLTNTNGIAKGGDTLIVSGSGFENRSTADKPELSIKLFTPDSGTKDKKQIPLPSGQPCAGDVDGSGTLTITDQNCLPLNDGGIFTVNLKLPEELEDGQYEIRILGKPTNGGGVSKHVLFDVKGEEPSSSSETPSSSEKPSPSSNAAKPPADNEPSDQQEASLTVGEVKTAGDGESTVDLTAAGFAPEGDVTAEVDGTPVEWSAGHHNTNKSTEADPEGGVKGTLVVPAGVAPAGSPHEITLKQGDKTAKGTFEPTTGLSVPKGMGTAQNSTTDFIVANLPKGATVTSLKAGDHNLWEGKAKAGEDGKATIKDVAIAKEAPLDEPIVVNWKIGDAEHSDTSSLKITPDNTPFDEESFQKTDTGDAITGASFYQTAVGKEFVFATSSVGRPPVHESAIYKLDPNTLKELDKHEAEEVPGSAGEDGKPARYAVYGIGVDNTDNNPVGEPLVWVTNTRQNEIAVYKQSDLSLVARSTGEALKHGRDVVVDPATGKVYASSINAPDGAIEVFQLKSSEGGYSIEKTDTITLPDFPMTMSLDFDEKEGVLYTTSLKETKAAAIHVRDGNKIDFFKLDSENAASGVAFDPVSRNLYMPTQGGNDVIVVNTVTGKTIARIPTGAQALNSVYASKNGLVYAVNRSGGTVTVLNAYDPAGEAGGPVKLANLTIGKNANHLSVTDDGIVYVTDKDDPSKVHRIEPTKELKERTEILANDVPTDENNYGNLQAPDTVKKGEKEVPVSFGKKDFWNGQLADLYAEPKAKAEETVKAVTEKAAREEAAPGGPIKIASDLQVDGKSEELTKADLSALANGDYTLVARGKHGNVLAWKDLSVTEDGVAPVKPGEAEKPGSEVSVEVNVDKPDEAKPGEGENPQGNQDAQGNTTNAVNQGNQANQGQGSLAKTGANATPLLLGLLAAAVIASGAVFLRRRQS